MVALIALHSLGEFIHPPRRSRFGRAAFFAIFMSVPKATVHKDDGFVFGEYDVRFAGKRLAFI